MFCFGKVATILNYKCDEMHGVLSHTDTRFRGDQRLYEEGKTDDADEEKIRLEVKQRKARKLREEACETWTPIFFREAPHQFLDGQIYYEFIQENNYWDRRERKDWSGLPDLWGQ